VGEFTVKNALRILSQNIVISLLLDKIGGQFRLIDKERVRLKNRDRSEKNRENNSFLTLGKMFIVVFILTKIINIVSLQFPIFQNKVNFNIYNIKIINIIICIF
jgi:hypothetical protein